MKSRNLGSNRNGKKHRERKVSPASAGVERPGKFPTFETDERLYTLYIFQEEKIGKKTQIQVEDDYGEVSCATKEGKTHGETE